jgi:phosphotransferase system enzyme I (PtsI)
MEQLSGIPASAGIVTGEAFLYLEHELPEIRRYAILPEAVASEWERFLDAKEKASAEIAALLAGAAGVGREQAAIFEAQMLMAQDPDMHRQVRERLEGGLENVEWTLWSISQNLSRKLFNSADPYLRERASDIIDVSRRIIDALLSIKRFSLADLEKDVILVVHDLLPTDALAMKKAHVKGIVMDSGSRTSHVAILARAFGIPAVLGLSNATHLVKNEDSLIVDGTEGWVLVNPDRESLRRFTRMGDEFRRAAGELLGQRDLPAVTLDGRKITLKANIEIPEEAEGALDFGAEGIGLYRSEFLFLSPGHPAEEQEQFLAYRRVLQAMDGKPVTIRTLDLGGDKILPDLQGGNEKNPLLGWRATRFCLSLPELFKTQLRALLRASVEGNLRIMFPMISGIGEFVDVLALLETAKAECREQGLPFNEEMPVGVMIEVPSAALTADILAQAADFFSIGTNDLLQYTMAVDRGNEKVSYLAQPLHPAVLRSIRMTIDGAHSRGIPAALCGELAGDPLAAPALLGLGLDEFSMTASSIPLVKKIIRSVSMKDCEALAASLLAAPSHHMVTALLEDWLCRNVPDGLEAE